MDPSSGSVRGRGEALGESGSPRQASVDPSHAGGSNHEGPPQRTPSLSNINKSAHRQSFAENLRNVPPSPRHRHPSFTQAAVQELLNHPPSGQRHTNPKFAGKEWVEITVGELVSPDDVKWVDMDSSVEEATMALLKSKTNVVLVRESSSLPAAVATFDYSDLNAYLLVVVGLSKPEAHQVELYNDIMLNAREGKNISMRQIQPLCRQEPLVGLPSNGNLAQAIEILGSGIHRILITNSLGNVVGIMSQLLMVDFFWNEGVNFPAVDRLYPIMLRDLGVGAQQVISVNSDAALAEALILMNNEGLTSVAVVDNGQNVVGNISTKDVRHLTSASSAPLLDGSCMHFISVILNERGVEKGRDTFPVFFVNTYSTLAHTVAKLVATRSHRMWVVESASPSPSAPATPLMGPHGVVSTPQAPMATPTSAVPSGAVPASAMPGAHLSGKLSGVLSLTDVLNIFAKYTGLHPADPSEQRARRRRSSSSSIRPSLDSSRPSLDFRH
ncbi:Cystathionine beta-synthase, core [Metarhizium robertsii ARSEF 23]|uniref:Protein SDS23 n=1 Tax=Metarhizium robertsii (strain ARSEF 23 / ATCC MYA-3075) TaxID=655844 RepID=E9EWQ2_METRA|nr:Cystathionine beta-synthase, core [Metarhizium robertsii ARSEF 23]EFY99522.1 Cystathionine beta-synthase, core [Metarhizium robertsii ARSEF 23]